MSEPQAKPVLGLIGTIGAGKSAAAFAFANRGAVVVDADRVGHVVLDVPAVREKIKARWGDAILQADGRVNRRAVAAIVFANDSERRALESIVFPEIECRCRELIASAQGKFVVLDAAVMLEAGWSGFTDKLVFVDAPRVLRMQRVAARGWSVSDLARREAAQWPAESKRARADAVIENVGTLEELQAAVDQLLARWGWL